MGVHAAVCKFQNTKDNGVKPVMVSAKSRLF